jgi:hypothetical protein
MLKPLRKLALLSFVAAALVSPAAGGAAGPIVVSGFVHDFDGGVAIGGETDPYGWVLSPESVNRPIKLARIAYLDASASGVDLARFAGSHCTIAGTLVPDALRAGGVETPLRTFDLIHVDDVRLVVPPAAPVMRPRWQQRLLADLDARGVDIGRDGSGEPSGGLDARGRLPNGRPAMYVPLFLPPPDSADMQTDGAYVDRRRRRYWARRTGGFAPIDVWVGPFEVPRPKRR